MRVGCVLHLLAGLTTLALQPQIPLRSGSWIMPLPRLSPAPILLSAAPILLSAAPAHLPASLSADVTTDLTAPVLSLPLSLPSLLLSSPPLLRDSLCAIAVALAAAIWIGFWSRLAANGQLQSTISRKLIHTGSAPLFLVCWPLFSDGPSARIAACLVPLLQVLRLARAGLGSGGATDVTTARQRKQTATEEPKQPEEALVAAVSRSGERSEALGGPLLYTLVLLAATALGWRSPVAAVAVCQMAFGDGIADIFGRRWGRLGPPIPWCPQKSLVGSGAFVLSAWLSSCSFIALFHACGFTALTAQATAVTLLAISIVSALVESGADLFERTALPPVLCDDNFNVPLVATVLSLLWLQEPGVVLVL